MKRTDGSDLVALLDSYRREIKRLRIATFKLNGMRDLRTRCTALLLLHNYQELRTGGPFADKGIYQVLMQRPDLYELGAPIERCFVKVELAGPCDPVDAIKRLAEFERKSPSATLQALYRAKRCCNRPKDPKIGPLPNISKID